MRGRVRVAFACACACCNTNYFNFRYLWCGCKMSSEDGPKSYATVKGHMREMKREMKRAATHRNLNAELQSG